MGGGICEHDKCDKGNLCDCDRCTGGDIETRVRPSYLISEKARWTKLRQATLEAARQWSTIRDRGGVLSQICVAEAYYTNWSGGLTHKRKITHKSTKHHQPEGDLMVSATSQISNHWGWHRMTEM